jgi:hypothetical protein
MTEVIIAGIWQIEGGDRYQTAERFRFLKKMFG